jgi:hypothetical protein
MQPSSYPTYLLLGRSTRRWTDRTPRWKRLTGHVGVARGRLPKSLSDLPRWVHGAPYVALGLLGAVLLIPGVVPHGPSCGDIVGAAAPAVRQLFIRLSAIGFGLVAALLLLSALAASAQRREGRPGRPTIVIGALLGTVTIAAVIWPHAPVAAPAQALMVIDVLGLLVTGGAALAIPAVAGTLAWSRMSGPRSVRAAQIAAWTVLLLVLPLFMALTYVTVTPICFGD